MPVSEQGDTRLFKGEHQICAGLCEVCGQPVWRYLNGGPVVHREHYGAMQRLGFTEYSDKDLPRKTLRRRLLENSWTGYLVGFAGYWALQVVVDLLT